MNYYIKLVITCVVFGVAFELDKYFQSTWFSFTWAFGWLCSYWFYKDEKCDTKI